METTKTVKRPGDLTKRERALMAIRIMKYNSRYRENPTIVKLVWSGDNKERPDFWLNADALEAFFAASRILDLTAVYYTHQPTRTLKDLTGKKTKKSWGGDYVQVAII